MEKEIKKRIKAAHGCSALGVFWFVLPFLLLVPALILGESPLMEDYWMFILCSVIVFFLLSIVFLSNGLWRYWRLLRDEVKSIWFSVIGVVDVGVMLVDILIVIAYLMILFGPKANIRFYV